MRFGFSGSNNNGPAEESPSVTDNQANQPENQYQKNQIVLNALSKIQVIVEFEPDGTVISANEKFCQLTGYTLQEIKGCHHSLLVSKKEQKSSDYANFWQGLKSGNHFTGMYKRIGKQGQSIWMQASYIPLLDNNGQVFKVVKIASDITHQKLSELEHLAQLNAIDKIQAVIEFNLDGTILTANKNFCDAIGYSLSEIKGKHHYLFVDPAYKNSQEYKTFWSRLGQGEAFSGEFKRLAKGGREIWIQASYNPLFNDEGDPYKIVKFATDITEEKRKSADYHGQIDAIKKSQAVIEFNMDGTIISANDNFCQAVGYKLEEIQGKHHRLFMEQKEKDSPEYKAFWQKLNQGEFVAGEFKRVGKNGREIWIQASYNPILDTNKRPVKVVKFAADITEQKLKNADYSGQIAAVSKSLAVIEFKLDGTIVTANENFCKTVGYSLSEIQGKHHSLFVEESVKNSHEYSEFWTKLSQGTYFTGEYKRVANGGKEIWIQASYNPIFDLSGKPYKVVKYATDITEQKLKNADFQGQIEAVNKSQAVIEFSMDGIIISANKNFCDTVGYELETLQGKHHRMFVDESTKNSPEYNQFWENLKRGEYIAGEFKRIDHHGKEIWIQASYNPIFDLNGKPFKVVKYAIDITAQKLKNVDYQGQIEAVGKSQAVIAFNMDGTIITANENFCKTVGYELQEIQGQHHRMFVENNYKNSAEYRQFWEQLNKGEFSAGEYKRIGKGGKEIWIQASYNPILDMNGKPVKVVKFATDITQQKLKNADYEGQIEAVGKSQAVIEFHMDGTIITANENFCHAVGYTLNEIINKHHRIFVEESERNSPDYTEFWNKLNSGQFQAGEFKRIHKSGNEIWIQASYNPIYDLNGKPFKVVKYATEITGRVAAVEQVKQSLLKLEQGNLNAEIDADFEEEFQDLKNSINNTVKKIREVVTGIDVAAKTVTSACDEIVQGNVDLSRRTEDQAASLEETASSMEEMTTTVEQNARNANIANEMADVAQTRAEDGGNVVESAVSSMQQINESSKKINDIISVIDEIAFQTNLLALNAAVEAARAGEQGRGFAVVAGEVRNLAQRSAGAAKEIKDLIRDSVVKIENGSQLVNESGTTLTEIVKSVREVKEMIAGISQSSSEQSAGISQVGEAISRMDEMTQQNAALVEQVSAAGESMAEQTRTMSDLITFFQCE